MIWPSTWPFSPDALLERIRRAPRLGAEQVKVLGVDDWAIKKGHSYGTILVDLERRRVVELLPERTAEALAESLKAHLNIEMVSRDRYQPYIDGIRAGAPKALQVADRWHLLKNLTDAVERLLERARADQPERSLEADAARAALRAADNGRLPQVLVEV